MCLDSKIQLVAVWFSPRTQRFVSKVSSSGHCLRSIVLKNNQDLLIHLEAVLLSDLALKVCCYFGSQWTWLKINCFEQQPIMNFLLIRYKTSVLMGSQNQDLILCQRVNREWPARQLGWNKPRTIVLDHPIRNKCRNKSWNSLSVRCNCYEESDMRWLEKYNLFKFNRNFSEKIFPKHSEVGKVSKTLIFVQPSTSEDQAGNRTGDFGVEVDEENRPGFSKYCQSTT